MEKEIINRIKCDYPLNNEIIDLSTPVISFGNFKEARVFTLGINPSNLEFQDSRGHLLKNYQRRLQTYSSLNLKGYEELTEMSLNKILNTCNDYFKKNPYKKWFDQLEPILNKLKFSYYDDSAAHVDLVQWATKKKWGDLDNNVKEDLINDGRDFLNYQLSSNNLQLIILNGRTVIKSFEKWSRVKLNYIESEGLLGNNAVIVEGFYNDKIRVLGWSTNIQSSRGVTNEYVDRLALKISCLYQNR